MKNNTRIRRIGNIGILVFFLLIFSTCEKEELPKEIQRTDEQGSIANPPPKPIAVEITSERTVDSVKVKVNDTLTNTFEVKELTIPLTGADTTIEVGSIIIDTSGIVPIPYLVINRMTPKTTPSGKTNGLVDIIAGKLPLSFAASNVKVIEDFRQGGPNNKTKERVSAFEKLNPTSDLTVQPIRLDNKKIPLNIVGGVSSDNKTGVEIEGKVNVTGAINLTEIIVNPSWDFLIEYYEEDIKVPFIKNYTGDDPDTKLVSLFLSRASGDDLSYTYKKRYLKRILAVAYIDYAFDGDISIAVGGEGSVSVSLLTIFTGVPSKYSYGGKDGKKLTLLPFEDVITESKIEIEVNPYVKFELGAEASFHNTFRKYGGLVTGIDISYPSHQTSVFNPIVKKINKYIELETPTFRQDVTPNSQANTLKLDLSLGLKLGVVFLDIVDLGGDIKFINFKAKGSIWYYGDPVNLKSSTINTGIEIFNVALAAKFKRGDKRKDIEKDNTKLTAFWDIGTNYTYKYTWQYIDVYTYPGSIRYEPKTDFQYSASNRTLSTTTKIVATGQYSGALSTPVAVKYTLANSKTPSIALRQEWKAAVKGTATHSLTIPDNLPTGTYILKASIQNQNGSIISEDITNIYIPAVNSTFTVSPLTRSVISGRGSTTFSITATGQWTASSNQSWCTISSSSGTGNATITANYTANTSNSSRTATITFMANGISYNAIVTQVGVTCVYSLSNSSGSYTASATTESFNLVASESSGCASWTASASHSWITITSATSGTGSATVNFSLSANTSTSSRTGTITIAGQTFTITQAGAMPLCTYSLSATSGAYSASFNNVTGSFRLNASEISGCASWDASASDSWINITSSPSGTGAATVNFSLSPFSVYSNGISTSRIGTISIAGQTFTITQAGTLYINVSSNAGYDGIDITTGSSSVQWSNSSNQSWCTLSEYSGTGSANVTIYFDANYDPSSRTATITTTIEGIIFITILTQAGY